MSKISVIINTRNEENEIVVIDMFSQDKTVAIAKKSGARVFSHKHTFYVEPARNFALRKATGEWILILDADEEITPKLAEVS